VIVSPSIKALKSKLNLNTAQAKLIKLLCAARDKPESLRELIGFNCADTRKYADACYSDPYASRMWRTTLVLHAVCDILSTESVEPLGENSRAPYAPDYEYCNVGDPYTPTLIYKRETDRLFIGCYGDIAESLYEAS
jgi:hypothetical protein